MMSDLYARGYAVMMYDTAVDRQTWRHREEQWRLPSEDVRDYEIIDGMRCARVEIVRNAAISRGLA